MPCKETLRRAATAAAKELLSVHAVSSPTTRFRTVTGIPRPVSSNSVIAFRSNPPVLTRRRPSTPAAHRHGPGSAPATPSPTATPKAQLLDRPLAAAPLAVVEYGSHGKFNALLALAAILSFRSVSRESLEPGPYAQP
jgi:hypothetical protein